MKAGEIRQDATRPYIKDDKMVVVHVGDKETPAHRIKALIIEANRSARQWNLGDWNQHGFMMDRQGWVSSAQGNRKRASAEKTDQQSSVPPDSHAAHRIPPEGRTYRLMLAAR